MTANKTQATAASVDSYLAAIADEAARADGRALVALMRKVTREPPVMWGAGIVGFGRYHYRYDSGREGDMCRIGFAVRKNDLTIYITDGFEHHAALLAQLGRHKTAKVCLYIKRLADVDAAVLERLIAASWAEMARRYP